jgi:hypothetical protein
MMLSFDDISEATLIARGQYSTLRQAHEKQKEAARKQLTDLQSYLNVTLRLMTANDASTQSIVAMIALLKESLGGIELTAADLVSLAEQRQALKPLAWG